ncbi:unnamed protein product [Ectocarpus sp. CCAP 1310/34]|nr:unnamed protein product [Ectocarpus sp. CCAP 1310/34]
MAIWKRFTGAVDSSAQSFLKNKRFSREKRKFTWDWHAWNLAFVSTPSLVLAYYLHGVEKQMLEDASIREEIQERTGVSSRGFLIPKKEVRDEVLGMLSAGNQPGNAGGKGGAGEQLRHERHVPADSESIERRLATIERMLSMQGGSSSSTPGAGIENGSGPMTDSTLSGTSGARHGKRVHSARNAASKADSSSGAEVSTFDKAIETASAAGSWLLQTGEAQGKRLLQICRSWMAGDERQEDATRSEKPGSRKIGTGQQEPGANHADVRRREELAARALAERVANREP